VEEAVAAKIESKPEYGLSSVLWIVASPDETGATGSTPKSEVDCCYYGAI